MSARLSRSKRRSAVALDEADAEVLDAEEREQAVGRPQSRRVKRRSTTPSNHEAAEEDGTDPAAGTGGLPAAGAPGRTRQQRVRFSLQEASKMTEEIQRLEAESAEALDKALALDISQTNIDSLVAKVVRYMLCINYEKPGVPVKRQDLTALLQKDHKGGRGATKLPSLVLPMAAAKLASCFGLEMREVKRQGGGGQAGRGRPAAAAGATQAGAAGAAAAEGGGGPGTSTYVLRSMLPSELVARYVQDPADDANRGLQTVVLALLQLNGGHMEEDELWRHLSSVGVEQTEKGNKFGKDGAAGLLDKMEKMRYIASKKQQPAGGGSMQTVYEIAENALDEYGNRIKALIDKWLSNAGGPAAAAAAGDEVE